MAKKTLLIVDDNEMLTRSIARVLRVDFDIVIAHDAQEALLKMASERVDVVLSDYQMPPGPDGLWLVSEVARLFPHVRRFLMSTPDLVVGLDAAIADGRVERCFEKPLDPREVVQAIDP